VRPFYLSIPSFELFASSGNMMTSELAGTGEEMFLGRKYASPKEKGLKPITNISNKIKTMTIRMNDLVVLM